MTRYLADTTILVEQFRGNPKAKLFLSTHQPNISVITLAELISGARNKEELILINKACHSLPLINLHPNITSKAIDLMNQYRLSHGLLFLDALIAATALLKKNVLITANVKDFKFITDLQIVSQAEIITSSRY